MIEGVNSDRASWGSLVVNELEGIFASSVECIVVSVDSIWGYDVDSESELSPVIIRVVCGLVADTVKRNRTSKEIVSRFGTTKRQVFRY